MDQVLAWLLAHQALLAGAIVGVLDLIFALVPGLEGNGLLHQLYLWLKSLVPKKDNGS